MKIGIDARLYGTKHRGIGRYVKKLVDGLSEIDEQNDYVIFLTEDNFDDFKTTRPNFRKKLLAARWYSLKEQWLAPLVVARQKLDLMHWPHFNVPYFYQGRFLVTIHDLIINHFPDSRATTLPPWQYRLKLKGFKAVIKKAVLKAEKIIVPSEFVKQDILNNYPVPQEKISVVYEGYFLEQGQDTLESSRFNVTKPYLLYVGAAYPHKNLNGLVRAFQKLNREKKYQLLLVGRDDYFYQRLKETVKNDPDIIFTGFVSDSELAGLYQRACLYVFPSLYEGFGLPALEAQAHGLAVVAAKNSSLPELLRESAIYFEPEKKDDLRQKIRLVLENQDLRKKLKAAGLENVKRFSWEKMVKETRAAYLS